MKASDIPAKFPTIWGADATTGFIRSVPVAPSGQPGAASLQTGFPPLTFTQLAAGGVPPFGQDTNGILNQITAWVQWQNAGTGVVYDSVFSAAIGGYPQGAILTSVSSTAAWWVSTTDDNTTNPDTGGAGWLKISPALVYSGNPNTHVAGTAGNASTGQPPSQVWDTADKIWWTCTTTGNTASAVWSSPTGAEGEYCGTCTGTTSNHVVTPPSSLQSLPAGSVISYVVGAALTNSGALTVQITGIGTYPTRKNSISGPVALTGGEAVAANTVDYRFDGTYLHLITPALGTSSSANQSSVTGTVAAVSGAITSGNFAQFSDTSGTVADSGFSPGSINGIGYTTLYVQGLLL